MISQIRAVFTEEREITIEPFRWPQNVRAFLTQLTDLDAHDPYSQLLS